MIPKFIDKSKIPHKPGVYIFKDQFGKMIYVGKAMDLYHRVSSYFSNSHRSSGKLIHLTSKIKNLETIIVDSELEALILEANLIKKYLPSYNIKLIDDKDYLYIKITTEDFPKIVISRKKDLMGAKDFFGPFPSSNTVKATLKKLRRIFPWCSNAKQRNSRSCFYYHLGLCPGACMGKINKRDYNKIINRFRKFMQGKKEEVIANLREEMEYYSKRFEFEKAQNIKKTIGGLNYLTQPNRTQVYLENPNFLKEQDQLSLEQLKIDLNLGILPRRIECFDISNTQGKFAVGSLVVLTHGDIDKKWYRKFKIKLEGKPDDIAMMSEMVKRRLNHLEWPKPDLILVDGGRGQVKAITQIVLEKGWKIPVLGLTKKTEWIYRQSKEVIKLPKSSLSLRILQKIRDEAHRTAISYHRKLRQGSIFSSSV